MYLWNRNEASEMIWKIIYPNSCSAGNCCTLKWEKKPETLYINHKNVALEWAGSNKDFQIRGTSPDASWKALSFYGYVHPANKNPFMPMNKRTAVSFDEDLWTRSQSNYQMCFIRAIKSLLFILSTFSDVSYAISSANTELKISGFCAKLTLQRTTRRYPWILPDAIVVCPARIVK